MSSCGCNANQTPKEAFEVLRGMGKMCDSAMGTGLYVVPAPQMGIDEYEVQLVPRVNYPEAMKRGRTCPGWKWIPEKLMTYEQILDYRQRIGCGGCCFGPFECPMACACGGARCV